MERFMIIPSWLLPTTLVFFISCIFVYTLKSKRSSMAAPKLPPNPPKLPIIGNLHHLLGKTRHQALWKLSQEYGPVMLLHIGIKPYLVISSSAMAKQVLKTQDHIFCSRPLSQAVKRLTYNNMDVAFSPHSNHWREMRKILVSEFTGPKRAKLFNHVLVTEMESTICSLFIHPSNTTVNLNKMFLDIVKGVVGKVAFGKNYTEEPLKGSSRREMVEEVLVMMSGYGSLVDNFPWFGQIFDKISGWSGKLEKCFSRLDAYLEMVINEHLDNTTTEISDDDKDFVYALLDLYSKESNSGQRLTKDEIKALIMDVLTGGIDSTVVTMVWAMSEIARNSRVMQKLQSEIRNCIGRKQKVDENDITKMRYLKMVVKETLRLHPAAPLLVPHECLSHSQIGGYDVFPGTTVLVNGWGIGRDPSTWGKNSTEFYPERFENLEVDFGRENFDMIPFGGGRRTCPAINNAPTTVEFTIANLLYWFDWKVPSGMKNEDLDMEEEGSLVTRKKSPLYLLPTKHNWED